MSKVEKTSKNPKSPQNHFFLQKFFLKLIIYLFKSSPHPFKPIKNFPWHQISSKLITIELFPPLSLALRVKTFN